MHLLAVSQTEQKGKSKRTFGINTEWLRLGFGMGFGMGLNLRLRLGFGMGLNLRLGINSKCLRLGLRVARLNLRCSEP